MLNEQVSVYPPTDKPSRSEAGLANLRPFQKGVSGNPGGRPKTNPEVKTLALKNSKAAMQRIVDLMQDEDPRVALMAAKEVLDRAFGKVRPSEDDDTDKRNVTINIVKYTDMDAGNQPPVQLAATTVSIRPLAAP